MKTIFDMKKDFDKLRCQGIMFMKNNITQRTLMINDVEIHVRVVEKEFPYIVHLMVIKIEHENLIIELT